MADTGTKERILENAVQIFSEKGFFGTSMRDIATASGCSLPTLYYHYTSKNDLFEEIVVNQFLLVTEKMNKAVDFSAGPEDIYFQVLKTRKELSGFDKAVYKMTLKVWMGFEDKGEVWEKVAAWEKRRSEANQNLVARAVKNTSVQEDLTEILINYMENVITRIVLLDEDLDDAKLKRQIGLLFQIGK